MTDPEQFEGFMRSYQDMVYATAFRLVRSESDAQDIAQEVFLKAYERFGELADSPTVGGWLKTVSRNLSLNHLTRYRGRWRFFSEMAPEGAEDERDFASEIAAPDEHSAAMEVADQRAILEEALEKLPDTQRIPLVLYHFEDMAYEEIAAQLKASLGKVKTDIHRGREALKKKLNLRLAELTE